MRILCTNAQDSQGYLKFGHVYDAKVVAQGRYFLIENIPGMWSKARFSPLPYNVSPDVEGSMAADILKQPLTKQVEPGGGMKFDSGKPDLRDMLHPLLLGCLDGLRGVTSILEFGAKKYAANSWQKLEDAEARYTKALMRHLAAIVEHGLLHKDEESGKLSIFHLACDALFLAHFAYRKAKAQAEKETH